MINASRCSCLGSDRPLQFLAVKLPQPGLALPEPVSPPPRRCSLLNRCVDRLAALKREDIVIEPAPGVVPIEREAGGLIIMKAIFTGPTGSNTCKALLDTGATFSLIPPRLARKIGVKAQGRSIVGIKSRQLSPITYTGTLKFAAVDLQQF